MALAGQRNADPFRPHREDRAVLSTLTDASLPCQQQQQQQRYRRDPATWLPTNGTVVLNEILGLLTRKRRTRTLAGLLLYTYVVFVYI